MFDLFIPDDEPVMGNRRNKSYYLTPQVSTILLA